MECRGDTAITRRSSRLIPYGHHNIDQTEIDAVTEVLKSDWLTQGTLVPEFEKRLSHYVSAEYCAVVSNCTAALHMACAAIGLGPGDSLWTSPISFVASANCARYMGASVDFVDINPETRNMSTLALAEKLIRAKKLGNLPKAIVPVHFAGNPCEMEAISVLAKEYGVRIIEDAAHAIGSVYHGQKIGSGQYSDITCFSFHPVKTMTTGEGGAAVTNSEALYEKMKLFRNHGIQREPEQFAFEAHGPWYYEQQMLGMNFRLTEIQAAIGIAQLEKLSGFIAERQKQFMYYEELLASLPVILPKAITASSVAWHLFPIEVKDVSKRRDVFEFMRENNIGVNVHYIPIHMQTDYQRLGFGLGDFPASEAYYRGAITLPLYPGLTQNDQQHIVDLLTSALNGCQEGHK